MDTPKTFEISLNGTPVSRVLRYQIETERARTLLTITAGMFSRIHEQLDTDNPNMFQIMRHNEPTLQFNCRKVREFSIKTKSSNELIQFLILEGETST